MVVFDAAGRLENSQPRRHARILRLPLSAYVGRESEPPGWPASAELARRTSSSSTRPVSATTGRNAERRRVPPHRCWCAATWRRTKRPDGSTTSPRSSPPSVAPPERSGLLPPAHEIANHTPIQSAPNVCSTSSKPSSKAPTGHPGPLGRHHRRPGAGHEAARQRGSATTPACRLRAPTR